MYSMPKTGAPKRSLLHASLGDDDPSIISPSNEGQGNEPLAVVTPPAQTEEGEPEIEDVIAHQPQIDDAMGPEPETLELMGPRAMAGGAGVGEDDLVGAIMARMRGGR